MADDTPKRGRKYDQVIDGAKQVFLAQGFEGASVDEIAKVAGVSKATLYSYFSDKKALYAAVARAKYQQTADLANAEMDLCAKPVDCLRLAAHKIVEETLTDFNRSVFRMAMGEAQRFPDLAQEFFEGGPLLIRRALIPYLQAATNRGDLDITDFDLAADQFAELCKSHLFPQFILGVRNDFTDAEKSIVAEEAVKMFLARYTAV